jgi:hypothetical protein
MRTATIVVLALTAIAACPVRAQLDLGPDGLGLYFDLEASEYCGAVQHGSPFEMYLILTNASAEAGVAGWECRIEYDPSSLYVLSWVVHNTSGSYFDPPNFAHGLTPPLPWSPTINLMTVTLLKFDADCTWFSIVPHPFASIPGEIVYLDAGDNTTLIPMHQSTGGPDVPVAGLDCVCPPPVAREITSWGAVKGVYRHTD